MHSVFLKYNRAQMSFLRLHSFLDLFVSMTDLFDLFKLPQCNCPPELQSPVRSRVQDCDSSPSNMWTTLTAFHLPLISTESKNTIWSSLSLAACT